MPLHKRPFALFSIVALSLALSPRTASADGEAWTVLEFRLPMLRQQRPQFGRLDLRFLTELRVAGRYSGIEQVYFRTGPLFWFTHWLFVGTHISLWSNGILGDRAGSASAIQLQTELRWDLEPNFFGRLGPFTVNSRNRIEFRWFNNAGSRWRFRSQLRINLAPSDWLVMPFIMEELLVDLSGEGVNQNRAHAGVGFQVLPNVRVDVAYMNRVRAVNGSPDWAIDHAGWVNVFVYIPNGLTGTNSGRNGNSSNGQLPTAETATPTETPPNSGTAPANTATPTQDNAPPSTVTPTPGGM